MSFSVSALTDYVNQTSEKLIVKMQLESKTAKLVQVMPGVKGPTTLNLLATDAVFQANGCGFNASGTTTLSQRTLTPGDVKINEALCPKTLATKYTQHMLKQGTRAEKEQVPFEQEYTDLKTATIAAQIETALWQGDTTSGTAALNKWDGYLKLLAASYLKDQSTSAGVKVVNGITGQGTIALTSGDATVTGTGTSFTTQVEANDKIRVGGVTYTVLSVTNDTALELTANAGANVSTTAYKIIPVEQDATVFATPYTAFSGTNALAIAQYVFKAIPVQILGKEDVVVFCGWDFFREFVTNVTNLNFFHYTAEAANGELIIPGTNIKLMAVNGLNSTSTLVAGSLSNFYYGVDLLGEDEKFDMWYSKDNDEVRFVAEFRAGVQVAYPSEIVVFQLTA